MRGGTLTGTGTLARFIVRRDRIRLPIWIGGIAVLVLSTAASIKGFYPTQAELEDAVGPMLDNAAVVAMQGPTYGIDTYGGQIVFQIGSFGYVAVALLAMFLVGRHTRADEEEGRLELVRSTVVGRHAPVTAVLVVAAGVFALLGTLITVSMLAQDVPAAGSILYGGAMASFGLFFACVSIVAVQVWEHNRAALGITGALLGTTYVARAVGDVGDGTLTWLSPMGWAQLTRPYADERPWPLLLLVGGGLALVLLAFALLDRRDLGGGLLRARPGPPEAPPSLLRPLGLAIRLQRGTVVAWAAGLAAMGASYGAIAQDVRDLIGDSDTFADLIAQFGGDLTDSFLATSMLTLALVTGGFAVASTLRLKNEETGGRAEPLLATPLSRTRWAAAHLVVALVGATVVVLAAALGLGVTYAIAVGDAGETAHLVAPVLAFAPPLWVLVGLTFALYGLAPRATNAAWAALSVFFVIGFFGRLLSLPGWVIDLSPFQHVPQMPAEDFAFAPVAAVSALAVALIAAGFVGLRRRDLVA